MRSFAPVVVISRLLSVHVSATSWPRRFSTACCIIARSSRSRATATGFTRNAARERCRLPIVRSNREIHRDGLAKRSAGNLRSAYGLTPIPSGKKWGIYLSPKWGILLSCDRPQGRAGPVAGRARGSHSDRSTSRNGTGYWHFSNCTCALTCTLSSAHAASSGGLPDSCTSF